MMKNKISKIHNYIIDPVRALAEDGKLSGLLLIAATAISILVSNLPIGHLYIDFWNTDASISSLHLTVFEWINEALMPVFFLLVGLEIKRELIKGELSSLNQAIIPVVAAAGGMIIPAIIFILFNFTHPETIHGWAIPTATDIAFSLGILSLLGKRIPFSLVIFLMALAIIDDLGAILIIVFFYSGELHLLMILGAAGLTVLLILLNRLKVMNLAAYLIPGIVLWYLILHSGIHPTIAGVILAMTIPLQSGERLEHWLTRPVSYFVLPVFALANTALPLVFGSGNLFSNVSIGIILGLFIGKPLGIVGSSWLLVKFKFSPMLKDVNWKMMTGVGLIAGIGFTMSIFITTLSFKPGTYDVLSKLAVIIGSILSAVTGLFLLKKITSSKSVTH